MIFPEKTPRKVIGIIAECNPFHAGHAYLIRQAKALSGAAHCVMVMSGDFVQRGAPAILDKYTRASMALSGGADLVLEMPPIFAVSSAEDFAGCGISMLTQLGIVDEVWFGSECGDLSLLTKAAALLSEENGLFSQVLQQALREGHTYLESRELALRKLLESEGKGLSHNACSDEGISHHSGSDAEAAPSPLSLLHAPNNILGIEYCRAIRRLSSPLLPRTIRRVGAAYHDADIAQTRQTAQAPHTAQVLHTAQVHAAEVSPAIRNMQALPAAQTPDYPSASALRALWEGDPDAFSVSSLAALSETVIPRAAASCLIGQVPVCLNDFSALFHGCLLEKLRRGEDLTAYQDMSREIADRMTGQALTFRLLSDRIADLKTRQYTYSRISRAAMHLMLGHTCAEYRLRKEKGYTDYARVLGFTPAGLPLLHAIKEAGSLSLISRAADKKWKEKDLFQADLFSSHLYNSVAVMKGARPVSELEHSPVRIGF